MEQLTPQTPTREKQIYKVTLIGSLVNLLLTGLKFLAGILGNSGAMVADAVHSLSDLATDLVILLFVKISSKPKDENHAYGHGKFETLATILIGCALIAVALGIFINSIDLINKVRQGEILPQPGLIALIAAFISIFAKEALYWYTILIGRKINSPAVIANAWHHRSDALSSIGVLIGITGAHFLGPNWRILDPLAALIVSLLIMKVAYDLIMPSLQELLEVALPKEIQKKILHIITLNPEVHDPHNLKTRRIGSTIAIEVHIRVHQDKSVAFAHTLTDEIEFNLKEQYGDATFVIIHVEPYTPRI